jgi:hypothetical protein
VVDEGLVLGGDGFGGSAVGPLGEVEHLVEQATPERLVTGTLGLVPVGLVLALLLGRDHAVEVVERRLGLVVGQHRDHSPVHARPGGGGRPVADQPHLVVGPPRQLGQPVAGVGEQPAPGQVVLEHVAGGHQLGQLVEQCGAGHLVAVDRQDPVAVALGGQPRPGPVDRRAEPEPHHPVGHLDQRPQRGGVDPAVDRHHDLVGRVSQQPEDGRDLRGRLAGHAADAQRWQR